MDINNEIEQMLAQADEIGTLVNEASIITLVNDEGQDVKFTQIDEVEYQGKCYLILQPAEPMEDVEEDEAFVFEVVPIGDEECTLEMVLNDDIIDGVFETYYKKFEETEN
ncbi:MAG: DUF1292 domain-containing protein [Clostridia bacterium]|nr:DUF1292 domain-containing protein [Clostridia bacterium]